MPGIDESKRDPRETDPEALARALQLELLLKRAAWQKTAERRGRWRVLSILFLLLVFLAALFAWLFLAPQLRERGEEIRAAETSR